MCLALHHKSPKYFLTLVLMMAWIFASGPVYSLSLFEPGPFTIVLDPGHDAKNGGAMSATGTMEVLYNERLTEVIKTELETISQVKVAVTRSPGEVVGLQGRAVTANEMEANLFISVHHDSVQTKYLKERNIPGRFETTVPIQGFSIFVSRLNGEYDKSLEFARLFGKELRRTKRSPSLHHAEKIKGENRQLLDPDLGVYQFDELIRRKTPDDP